MRKWLVIVVSLVLLLAGVWLLSRGDKGRESATVVATERGVDAKSQLADRTTLDAPDEGAVRATAVAERAGAEGASASRAQAVVVERAEIRGRFLLPGGAAAVGVGVKLVGASGNQERAVRFGVPDDWKDIEVKSGSDGRFVISFDPPRAFQFFMKSSFANYCDVSWRWSEIEPKKVVDVGDVTLVRGGSIRGRIVDAKDRALTEGWTVYAEAGKRDFTGGKDQTRVVARPDAASGEYLLLGVPPGSVHLTANSRIANWIEGPDVEVRENEETRADIKYSGPELGNRITVTPFSRPFHVFEFGDFDFVLRGADATERKAKKLAGSSQTFVFEELAPGSYHVELRDPRFEPWSQDGVQPGSSLDVKLKGNAALVLRVVDDATNEPVNRYALDIRYDKTNSSPSSFRILDAKAEPPTDGFFGGIVPAEATAIVRVDGYSSCEIPLTGFAPNERRGIEARLVRATKLTGRVLSGPERTPIAGAKIELSPKKPESKSGMRRPSNLDPDAKSSESDASGAFSFDNLSVGEFTVRASLNKIFSVEQTITIAKSIPLSEVELLLPARAWLVGKLIAPAGADMSGLKLFAAPTAMKDPRFAVFRGDDVSSPLAADGSFRVGPIPAGAANVSVILPEMKRSTGRNGWTSSPGATIDFGTVELLPNVETRRDFELGANCPSALTCLVTVDGAAASDFTVQIDDTATRRTAGYVALDAAGKGRSGPLLPGTYGFMLLPLDGSAAFPLDQQVELRSNQVVSVVLSLQLFAGTIRVLDVRDGTPLAKQQVTLVPDSPDPRPSITLLTDADGRVTARVPAGRYRVAAGASSFSALATEAVFIDWSASGASPAEARVRLPARD